MLFLSLVCHPQLGSPSIVCFPCPLCANPDSAPPVSCATLVSCVPSPTQLPLHCVILLSLVCHPRLSSPSIKCYFCLLGVIPDSAPPPSCVTHTSRVPSPPKLPLRCAILLSLVCQPRLSSSCIVCYSCPLCANPASASPASCVTLVSCLPSPTWLSLYQVLLLSPGYHSPLRTPSIASYSHQCISTITGTHKTPKQKNGGWELACTCVNAEPRTTRYEAAAHANLVARNEVRSWNDLASLASSRARSPCG